MSEEANRESGAVSVQDAVAHLTGGLLEPEGQTKKRRAEEQPEGEAEAPQQEETEGEELEASEDAGEEAGEDTSEDAAEEAEEPEEEPRYTVRVDGKDVEVSLSELTAGYSRESDYRRKTQRVAEERRQLEAHASEAAEIRRQYAERLQQLEAMIPAEQEPDWEQLAADDPSEYVRQKAVHETRQRKLYQLRAAQQEEMQRYQREQAARMQEVVRQEVDIVLQKIPAWRDEKVRSAEKQKLVKYGQEVGFSLDELNGLYDHRPLLVLHKTMKYGELVKSKAGVTKKANEAPKMMKPGAANDRTKAQLNSEKRIARLNRVRKTGSIDDAAAFLRGRWPSNAVGFSPGNRK